MSAGAAAIIIIIIVFFATRELRLPHRSKTAKEMYAKYVKKQWKKTHVDAWKVIILSERECARRGEERGERGETEVEDQASEQTTIIILLFSGALPFC